MECRHFYDAVGNDREGLIPPLPARSSPTQHTSGRERSSSIRVVIFFTSSTTPLSVLVSSDVEDIPLSLSTHRPERAGMVRRWGDRRQR